MARLVHSPVEVAMNNGDILLLNGSLLEQRPQCHLPFISINIRAPRTPSNAACSESRRRNA
eukprot:1194265-Prorocentrum_minimum.AAC.4